VVSNLSKLSLSWDLKLVDIELLKEDVVMFFAACVGNLVSSGESLLDYWVTKRLILVLCPLIYGGYVCVIMIDLIEFGWILTGRGVELQADDGQKG